jgi:hypothetical protein
MRSFPEPTRFQVVIALFLIATVLHQGFRAEGHQAQNPTEKLHRVISRQKLTPPLRSANASLRFSPDGRFMMVQNLSGIYLLSLEPLKVVDYFEAPSSYPARFSSDSQSVVLVTLGLSYLRTATSDHQRAETKQLPVQHGCLAAQLSPDGELLACLRPDLGLGVLRLSTGDWIYSDKRRNPNGGFTLYPVPLDLETPFAGPFGYFLSNDLEPLANRGIVRRCLEFSPDSKSLFAGDERDAVRVDLSAQKRINLPGAFQKRMAGTFSIQQNDRALVMGRESPRDPALLSLSNGQILAKLTFEADSARLASDPRYALLHDHGKQGTRIFDLQEDKALKVPDNVGADVFRGELAVLNENGALFVIIWAKFSLSQLFPCRWTTCLFCAQLLWTQYLTKLLSQWKTRLARFNLTADISFPGFHLFLEQIS